MNTRYTVKRIGPNNREVRPTQEGVNVTGLHSTLVILISYDTPVAFRVEGRPYRTQTRWSRSTEAQIDRWIRDDWQARQRAAGSSLPYPVPVHTPQYHLDTLLIGLTGDNRLTETRDTSGEAPRINTRGVNYDEHTQPGDKHLVVEPRRRYR